MENDRITPTHLKLVAVAEKGDSPLLRWCMSKIPNLHNKPNVHSDVGLVVSSGLWFPLQLSIKTKTFNNLDLTRLKTTKAQQ